jgi:hypothetical protein
LNQRPFGPQPNALPDCATPRSRFRVSGSDSTRATGIEPVLRAWNHQPEIPPHDLHHRSSCAKLAGRTAGRYRKPIRPRGRGRRGCRHQGGGGGSRLRSCRSHRSHMALGHFESGHGRCPEAGYWGRAVAGERAGGAPRIRGVGGTGSRRRDPILHRGPCHLPFGGSSGSGRRTSTSSGSNFGSCTTEETGWWGSLSSAARRSVPPSRWEWRLVRFPREEAAGLRE